MRTVSATVAPMRSIVSSSEVRRAEAIIPGVTVMPLRSVILCVRTVNFSEEKVPAEVRRTRWKVYSVSTARPDIFVAVRSVGRGMVPAFWPFLKSARERRFAVARSIGSHSSTTAVCVAFLHRRTGAEGAREPKEERIVDWRLANAAEVLSSVT
jgi:hypothetical protein